MSYRPILPKEGFDWAKHAEYLKTQDWMQEPIGSQVPGSDPESLAQAKKFRRTFGRSTNADPEVYRVQDPSRYAHVWIPDREGLRYWIKGPDNAWMRVRSQKHRIFTWEEDPNTADFSDEKGEKKKKYAVNTSLIIVQGVPTHELREQNKWLGAKFDVKTWYLREEAYFE